jgi:hypothetical protein
MKTFYALLIAALFTTAACSKKKDEPAKTDPAKTDPAMKPTDPPKTDTMAPDPAKTAEPPKTDPAPAGALSVDDAGKMANDFADKITKVTTDAGNDCAKLGAGLKGLTEDAKKAAAAEKEFEKSADNKKAFKDKYQTEIDKKMKEPMGKIEKCMTNADVKAFIDTLAAE